MELHISILQAHGPVPTLTGDHGAAASLPASRAAVKVKAVEEKPAREQKEAKLRGERPPRFPEKRRVQVAQEPGWAADAGEEQCPPSAAVTSRPTADRGSASAVPGPAVGTRPWPAMLTPFPGPRSVPATPERVSTHLLGLTLLPGYRRQQEVGKANRRPVPPGLMARGQVQRESWELRAPLPPPQDAGERAVGCTLPGERHAWHAAGEQLSFGVPPGHRARSAVQGTDHPRCPCSLLCLRGEPDPLGRASGQATRCLGTGEEGAGPARRPGLRRKSIRERRAGSLTVSSERAARACAGNVYA